VQARCQLKFTGNRKEWEVKKARINEGIRFYRGQEWFRAAPVFWFGAARNLLKRYFVVEVPVSPDVVFASGVVVFDFDLDFLSDLSEVPGVFAVPAPGARPEFISGGVAGVGVAGVLVPGLAVVPGEPGLAPGVVVVPGVEVLGVAGVPAPPACPNSSDPPRKIPTAGVSNTASFLRIMISLADETADHEEAVALPV
jgi:hypothetical protein